MKQEQVIELALQADPDFLSPDDMPYALVSLETVTRFAKLVEQATLERAAREAKQSEAKMPEPAAVVHAKLGTTCMIPGASIRKGDKLYTEQQLRTLLAQHGIKIAD